MKAIFHLTFEEGLIIGLKIEFCIDGAYVNSIKVPAAQDYFIINEDLRTKVLNQDFLGLTVNIEAGLTLP